MLAFPFRSPSSKETLDFDSSILLFHRRLVQDKMLLNEQWVYLALFGLSFTQYFMPEFSEAVAQINGVEQDFEHVVPAQEGLRKRNALVQPREIFLKNPPGVNLMPDQSTAMAKRMLLGPRQSRTCDAGYSYCQRVYSHFSLNILWEYA